MNIATLVEDNIKRFGERETIYFEGRWYTNVERNSNANRLGNALKALGIKRGDKVAVQLPNCPPVLWAFPAILKIGGVVVPLSPVLRPDEAAYIYQDSGVAAVISSSDYLERIKQAQKEATGLQHIILVDKEDEPGTISYEKIMAGSSDELVIEETDNDDLATLIYTAGTTGRPKGVMHTHYSLYTNCAGLLETIMLSRSTTLKTVIGTREPETGQLVEEVREVSGLDAGQTSLGVLPLSHSFGIAVMNIGYLVAGRSILMKWWNVEEALKAIERFGITTFFGVPTMYVQVLNFPDLDKYDLSSIQYCACGSAPLPVEVIHAWKEKFGLDIGEGWGLTEAGANNSGQPADRPPKYGSIGKCLQKCNTMKIFDEEGKEVPQGQVGEIVIKGPSIMKGYWNMPEETAEVIKDGWLYTGDIGYVDEDGYFYITERKKDLIIRGGENVYPREVEEILYQHPKVMEAGVIGIPDKVYGEEIKAFVSLKPGESATAEELIAFCKERLATFKIPKSVQFMDSLPKSLVGKVLRKELRALG